MDAYTAKRSYVDGKNNDDIDDNNNNSSTKKVKLQEKNELFEQLMKWMTS